MTPEPSYPDDAPVGGEPAEPAADAEKDSASKRTRHIVTGAAIGIGSAAVVAALLYANRTRKGGGGDRD